MTEEEFNDKLFKIYKENYRDQLFRQTILSQPDDDEVIEKLSFEYFKEDSNGIVAKNKLKEKVTDSEFFEILMEFIKKDKDSFTIEKECQLRNQEILSFLSNTYMGPDWREVFKKNDRRAKTLMENDIINSVISERFGDVFGLLVNYRNAMDCCGREEFERSFLEKIRLSRPILDMEEALKNKPKKYYIKAKIYVTSKEGVEDIICDSWRIITSKKELLSEKEIDKINQDIKEQWLENEDIIEVTGVYLENITRLSDD